MPPTADDSSHEFVNTYCVTCHNDKAKTGGLTLASFDAARPEQNPEVAEKMIHKLRLGMMPPPEVRRRPDPAAVTHELIRREAEEEDGRERRECGEERPAAPPAA